MRLGPPMNLLKVSALMLSVEVWIDSQRPSRVPLDEIRGNVRRALKMDSQAIDTMAHVLQFHECEQMGISPFALGSDRGRTVAYLSNCKSLYRTASKVGAVMITKLDRFMPSNTKSRNCRAAVNDLHHTESLAVHSASVGCLVTAAVSMIHNAARRAVVTSQARGPKTLQYRLWGWWYDLSSVGPNSALSRECSSSMLPMLSKGT